MGFFLFLDSTWLFLYLSWVELIDVYIDADWISNRKLLITFDNWFLPPSLLPQNLRYETPHSERFPLPSLQFVSLLPNFLRDQSVKGLLLVASPALIERLRDIKQPILTALILQKVRQRKNGPRLINHLFLVRFRRHLFFVLQLNAHGHFQLTSVYLPV